MDLKDRVFISATSDLTKARAGAIRAVELADCTPEAMENWAAASPPPDVTIRERLAGCTLFVLLAGGKYGSRARRARRSYVERELKLAKELGIPRIVLMQHGVADEGVEPEQKAFRRKLALDYTVRPWRKSSEIAPLVLSSILKTVKQESAVVFADNDVLKEEIGKFLNRSLPDRSSTRVAYLIQYSAQNVLGLVRLLLSKQVHTKLFVKCPGKLHKLSRYQEARIKEATEVQIWNEIQHVGKDVRVDDLLEIYGYEAPGSLRALLIDRIRQGGEHGGLVHEHELVAVGAYSYMTALINKKLMLDIRGGELPGVILARGHSGFDVTAKMIADTVENWEKRPHGMLKRFWRDHKAGEAAWVDIRDDETESRDSK